MHADLNLCWAHMSEGTFSDVMVHVIVTVRTCVVGLCYVTNYSRLSLSQLRLSRITADTEVKIWSLFEHGNLTTGIKIL